MRDWEHWLSATAACAVALAWGASVGRARKSNPPPYRPRLYVALAAVEMMCVPLVAYAALRSGACLVAAAARVAAGGLSADVRAAASTRIFEDVRAARLATATGTRELIAASPALLVAFSVFASRRLRPQPRP